MTEPIAIVGMGCRFPMAPNLDDYWKLLADGTDAVIEVPKDRWDIEALYDPDPESPGKVCTRWGGFLENIDQFDAAFFSISPREAERVDPQQRLILEVAWEALEDAGIPPEHLSGSDTGVFVAISHSEYGRRINSDWERIISYNGAGMYVSIAANRLSYALNLQGPSMVIDTACSSSLVAVHQACQSLRLSETSVAIVGGVNLNLDPIETMGLTKAKMLSVDGRCKTFDDSANGYVRSDGCGVVILKRLSDALRDGDTVRAVIRGSAVNQDGLTNGLNAPSGPAQQAVIRRALRVADVDAADVGYVEAHGTGTSIGDPIEMKAILSVYGEGRPANQVCWVGSVKTNIGHLESASGMASLIKVVLSLEQREIFRHLHLKKLNRYMPLDGVPFSIPIVKQQWSLEQYRSTDRRLAGISAFGFGGTNAHVILEESVVSDAESSPERAPEYSAINVFTLSAKTEAALTTLAAKYVKFLTEKPKTKLADLCLSANCGRNQFSYRSSFVVRSTTELREVLDIFQKRAAPSLSKQALAGSSRKQRRIALAFTSDSLLFAHHVKQLYGAFGTFKTAFDACAAAYAELSATDLKDICFKQRPGVDYHEGSERSHISSFAVQYSTAALLKSWNIEPTVIYGAGSGELVGATIAGVFALENGIALITHLARSQALFSGESARLQIFVPKEIARKYVEAFGLRALDIFESEAGAPEVTVFGPTWEIELLENKLQLEEIQCRLVRQIGAVEYAPCLQHGDLLRYFDSDVLKTPRLKLVSDATGEVESSKYLELDYWLKHSLLQEHVVDSIKSLQREKCDICLEIGPKFGLRELLQSLALEPLPKVYSVFSGDESVSDQLQQLAASLYMEGVRVDWRSFASEKGGRRIRLPTYPFQRTRHWYDITNRPYPVVGGARRESRLLRGRLRENDAGGKYCGVAVVDTSVDAYFRDHLIQGSMVVPAAAFVEMAMAAFVEINGTLPAMCLENIRFIRPCFLSDKTDERREFALKLCDINGRHELSIGNSSGEDSDPYAIAILSSSNIVKISDRDFLKLPSTEKKSISSTQYYGSLKNAGIEYGSAFRGIEGIYHGQDEVLVKIVLPDALSVELDMHFFHPALLDACFQAVGCSLMEDDRLRLMVPQSIRQVCLRGEPTAVIWARVTNVTNTGLSGGISADVKIYDVRGQEFCGINGLTLSPIGLNAPDQLAQFEDQELDLEWHIVNEVMVSNDHGTDDRIVLINPPRNGLLAEIQGATAYASAHQLGVDKNESEVKRLMKEADTSAIVYFCSDPTLENGVVGDVSLSRVIEAECAQLRMVVRCLSEREQSRRFRLIIVTTNAQSVLSEYSCVDPLQTALWGIGRTIATEFPNLNCRLVDVDAVSANIVLRELRSQLPTFQFGWRKEARYELSYVRRRHMQPPKIGEFRAELVRYGDIDSWTFSTQQNAPLLPDEVLVTVRSAALNFRDVLNALGSLKVVLAEHGIYRAQDIPFGGECAGVVTKVGSAVTGLNAGDDVVVALTPGCLASTVVAKAALVFRKPKRLTFQEAATLSTAYLTAYYALSVCTKVKRGQRVLVHAAAGAVGQACIQLLQSIGAEVVATASHGKWDFLRQQGIEHIFDSRTSDFSSAMRQQSPPLMVDVVVNCLNGEMIAQSFNVLKSGGVFIELGKLGAWSPMDVEAYRPDVTYAQFDLLDLAKRELSLVSNLLRKIKEDIENSTIDALNHKAFSVDNTGKAFRYMAGSRHIGKIVINMPDNRSTEVASLFQPQAAYVVTGAFGILGLRLLDWAASNGCHHLILISRSHPNIEARQHIDRIESAGCKITVFVSDMSDLTELQKFAHDAANPSIRGVFHLAGITNDCLIEKCTEDHFLDVLHPKVDGLWNIHKFTECRDLDFFLCYSSASAVFGTPGQANYATANCFMDGLMSLRRSRGLPGTSINWGAFAEIGVSKVGTSKIIKYLDGVGIRPIPISHSMDLVRNYLGCREHQLVTIRIDQREFVARLGMLNRPMLDTIVGLGIEKESDNISGTNVDGVRGLAIEDASIIVVDEIKHRLVELLSHDVVNLSEEQSLSDLGVDSLVAMDLKERLEISFGVSLQNILVLQSGTLMDLAIGICGSLLEQGVLKEGHRQVIVQQAEAIDKVGSISNGRQASDKGIQLFCLHHLGGSASIFWEWTRIAPAGIEVCALQLPGRESRSSEGLINSFEALIDDLVDQIVKKIKGPFAFYGHSMGSLLAYELARHFELNHQDAPLHLFVGGLWAPHKHHQSIREKSFSAQNVLRDATLPAAISGDAMVMERLKKIFESDAKVFESYNWCNPPSLSLPITAFGGSSDDVARDEDLSEWRHCTKKNFSTHVVPGEHLFVRQSGREIMNIICSELGVNAG